MAEEWRCSLPGLSGRGNPHCIPPVSLSPDCSYNTCLNLRFPDSYHALQNMREHRRKEACSFSSSHFHTFVPLSFPFILTPCLWVCPFPLDPSICPSHVGFTSLLSMMGCFFYPFFFKWSNGLIRKQQRDKACRERKEKSSESRRTPVACYLITAVLVCHARLSSPLRSALSPL